MSSGCALGPPDTATAHQAGMHQSCLAAAAAAAAVLPLPQLPSLSSLTAAAALRPPGLAFGPGAAANTGKQQVCAAPSTVFAPSGSPAH